MSSPSRPSSHRLLYRGALSLPDSDLCLDGFTFTAQIDAGYNLLENPLALALESMRGRPTLRLMGTTTLKDVHMDNSGDIMLDIHPEAILSQIYMENMFCLPSTSKDTPGIRIALGDSETTQIIIFPKSVPNENDLGQPRHILSVARVTPMPVTKPRLPRPDDPTPRKPPLLQFNAASDLRRVASFNASSDLARKRQKLSNESTIANLGSDVRLVPKATPEFKVPSLPDKNARSKVKDKGKGKADVADDLELESQASGGKRKVENKGKRKRESEEVTTVEQTAQEKENRTHIKQVTVHYLAKSLVTKTHPEFKPMYQMAIQSVGFAVRNDIKVRPIDQQLIERLVQSTLGCTPDRYSITTKQW